MMTRRRRAADDRGIGLMGVLAVIVILGAVAALAVLSLNQQQAVTAKSPGSSPTSSSRPAASVPAVDSAVNAMAVVACEQLVAQVQTAIAVYSAEHGGTNPPGLAALVPGLLKTNPINALVHGQRLTYNSSTGAVTAKCK